MRQRARLLIACVTLGSVACGKAGPPLPPLRLVPAPVTDVVARRSASQVELRFVLPTRNQNGPGPINLDRIEIYAVTVPAGAPPPPNNDLMSKERLVGTIAVRPAPVEGEPAPEDPSDKRPAPGESAVFFEELTEEKLKPLALREPGTTGQAPPGIAPPEQTGAAQPPPPAAPKDPAAAGEAHPQRIYALRGVTRSGRPGPPAPRVSMPLASPPPIPTNVDVRFTERAFVISWLPPVAEPGKSPIAVNVFAADNTGAPLNASPIAGAEFEHTPVRFGAEQCFIVRSVKVVENVTIESGTSEATCISARDIFPPAPPTGLRLAAAPEGISLSWDGNKEEDLAGYLILRGEGDDNLQKLTPEPIRDTNYRDTAVKPGVTYVYALVAVDKAVPPNTSAPSERERATAR